MPRIVGEAYTELGIRSLAVEDRHAFTVESLPPLHGDPFDRLLIAQAGVEGFSIVTADPIFAQYPVEIVPADR